MNDDATIPEKGTPQSAGHDIFASEPSNIQPGDRKIIPTGLQIACQQGTYGRIAPRSGLTIKHGIDVGAGVIDPDYRGEVGVVLFNNDKEKPFHIEKGDKIAQLIIETIDDKPLEVVDTINATARGNKGFGSTGIKKADRIETNDNRPDPPVTNPASQPKQESIQECRSKQCNTRHKTNTPVEQDNKTSMLTTELWHQRMGHIGISSLWLAISFAASALEAANWLVQSKWGLDPVSSP